MAGISGEEYEGTRGNRQHKMFRDDIVVRWPLIILQAVINSSKMEQGGTVLNKMSQILAYAVLSTLLVDLYKVLKRLSKHWTQNLTPRKCWKNENLDSDEEQIVRRQQSWLLDTRQ